MSKENTFIDLIIAGMQDAAVERKMTQFKAQIDPDGKGLKYVRIIIVPETMDIERHPDHPFGSEKK